MKKTITYTMTKKDVEELIVAHIKKIDSGVDGGKAFHVYKADLLLDDALITNSQNFTCEVAIFEEKK